MIENTKIQTTKENPIFAPNPEYLESNAVWIAHLSDGSIAYEWKDPCWSEFKDYVESNNLKVVNLGVKFRSNVLFPLPENAEGYAVIGGCAAELMSGLNFTFKKIGYIQGDKLITFQYSLPALIFLEREERDVSGNSHLIIKN
jgi:hypothetical protein